MYLTSNGFDSVEEEEVRRYHLEPSEEPRRFPSLCISIRSSSSCYLSSSSRSNWLSCCSSLRDMHRRRKGTFWWEWQCCGLVGKASESQGGEEEWSLPGTGMGNLSLILRVAGVAMEIEKRGQEGKETERGEDWLGRKRRECNSTPISRMSNSELKFLVEEKDKFRTGIETSQLKVPRKIKFKSEETEPS